MQATMGELKPEEIRASSGDSSYLLSNLDDCDDSKDDRNHLNIPGTPSLSNSKGTEYDKVSLRSCVSVTELDTQDRETWDRKIDFLLSVIGFAVDLGNVWRFPYLVFKNGGGCFFIPYFMMLLLAGIPLFYMELALGQYNRKGAITTWGRICPLFKGIGYCVVMIAFYTDFFYNVIISWSLYYFFASFTDVVPWKSCNNSWNRPGCFEPLSLDELLELANHTNSGNICLRQMNTSEMDDMCVEGRQMSASEQYFSHNVLSMQNAKSVTEPGVIKWQLVLCLLAIYLICYFSLWKGIKMSGKVVWFTAIFPYVVLFCLLIRGLTLPGASEGIKYYLYPDISKLAQGEVWFDAATQVFFSLGPGFGVLMAFASYNKFHNNVYYDALLTSSINSATSFLAGFVIFSVLGYMSCASGKPIDKVATEGPGLVFVVYPEAIATMPYAPVWAIIFFLMLLTLGLDSSFGGSEAIITGLSDEFPIIKRHREIFIALLFSLYMLVGLLMCTEGGIFFVEFLTTYAATYGMLIAVLCESLVVAWIYGLDRFSDDIYDMMNFRPGYYWKFCWAVFGPAFLMYCLAYGFISYKPLNVQCYEFPVWMNVLGWLVALSSAICIPVFGVYQLYHSPGNTFMEKFRNSLKPWKETVDPESLPAVMQSKKKNWNNNVMMKPISYPYPDVMLYVDPYDNCNDHSGNGTTDLNID